MKWTITLLALGVTLFSGCKATSRFEQFTIPRDEFFAQNKTIALAPVIVPSDLSSVRTACAAFDTALEQQLHAAGFQTIACNEYGRILDLNMSAAGGLFDPMTGKPDEAKVEGVHRKTIDALAVEHDFDAVLYPSVVLARARFSSGGANWDGVSESMGSTDASLWEKLSAGNYQGKVPALTLVVVIEDKTGSRQYLNGGGIQVLAELRYGELVDVPTEKIFSYDERNLEAVAVALGPLVGGS